jgi:type IV secretion system protein VirB10
MPDEYTPDQDDEFSPTPDLNRVQNDLNSDFTGLEDDIGVDIENEASQVASTPKKNMLIMGILIVVAVVFLYNVVFKDTAVQQEQKEKEKIIEQQPVEKAVTATEQDEKVKADIGIVETPELPDIEGLPALPPPAALEIPEADPIEFEPTPVIEPIPTPTPVKAVEPTAQPVVEPIPEEPKPELVEEKQPVITGPSQAEIAAMEASRRKSGMLVMNGGGGPEGDGTTTGSPTAKKTDELTKTGAAQVTATLIGKTDNMIAQGKMIEAILETAINTSLPGSLRAVISRDVYAETGNAVLIPKGSRLIGEYDNNIKRGQQRIIVTWNRVIRPDGIDIAIASPGTDQLGRAGMAGIVDNKYFEIIGNSILLSAVTIAGSVVADAISPSSGTSSSTTTGSDGSTTTSNSGTPTDFAVIEGVKNVGDVASDISKSLLNDQPIIAVNQGARIRVFVNRDLIFPESTVGKIKVVD